MPTRRTKRACCKRFRECVQEGSIKYCGKRDETEWAIGGFYHLYYCPFCGAFVKGAGWGNAERDRPRGQPNGPLERAGTNASRPTGRASAGRSAPLR
jgi:hypothetical protein